MKIDRERQQKLIQASLDYIEAYTHLAAGYDILNQLALGKPYPYHERAQHARGEVQAHTERVEDLRSQLRLAEDE